MESSEYLMFQWKGQHWPAKILRRSACERKKKKKYIQVEILGEGSRVWIHEDKAEHMTHKAIESISVHLNKNTSKQRNPERDLRELTHRKALRLALEVCAGTSSSFPRGHPSTAQTERDQLVTLEEARDISNTHESQSEVVPEGTGDMAQSSPLKQLQVDEADSQDDDDDDEEEDDLPRFCTMQEEGQALSITEGSCVWGKRKALPYWPSMVKHVYHKKASVVFIDEWLLAQKTEQCIIVPLRRLKPLHGKETAELVDKARDRHGTAIYRCLEVIEDYRIRLGCRSFSGSMVEYIADDISLPVRNRYLHGPAYLPSANHTCMQEEDLGSPASSPDQELDHSKRILPDLAERNRANEKIVHYIVKEPDMERHLQAVIKGQKPSKWLQAHQNARRRVVNPYFENDQLLDRVYYYLKDVLSRMCPSLSEFEKIPYILDVLLPEAVIQGMSAVDGISVEQAGEKYERGRGLSQGEREEFDLMVEKYMKERKL